MGTAAQAQTVPIPVPVPLDPAIGTVTVKQPNANVTKIDGTILGNDVKVIENPAQINVKVKAPDGSKAMVKLPTDATSINDATKIKIKPPK
jgi:hypothetical protein